MSSNSLYPEGVTCAPSPTPIAPRHHNVVAEGRHLSTSVVHCKLSTALHMAKPKRSPHSRSSNYDRRQQNDDNVNSDKDQDDVPHWDTSPNTRVGGSFLSKVGSFSLKSIFEPYSSSIRYIFDCIRVRAGIRL